MDAVKADGPGWMKSLVILGNSPFVSEVDIPAILDRHTVVGFNGMGQHYALNAVFCFDRWYEPGRAERIFHPAHIKPPKACTIATAYDYKSAPKPFLKAQGQAGKPLYAFKYFSPSIALNWAILEGFKRAYLVGIDHVETDTRFQHHDAAPSQSELTIAAHQGFKKYVYACSEHIQIYQTNPAVRKGWELPFQEIKGLYA